MRFVSLAYQIQKLPQNFITLITLFPNAYVISKLIFNIIYTVIHILKNPLYNQLFLFFVYYQMTSENQKETTNTKVSVNKETVATMPNVEYVNLKVKSQDGEEIFFKIKKNTIFKKLMDAYCQRQNLTQGNIRFLFDGDRVTQNQTPKDLNMENGDEIDAVIQQQGGSSNFSNH